LPLWPTISTSISDVHIENGCDTQSSDILVSTLDHQLKAYLRERTHGGDSMIAISSKEAFC